MNLTFKALLENLCKTTNSLSYEKFICSVCMMFDEYHQKNPNSPTPPEMAQTVADLVAQVNEQEGPY